MEARKRTPWVLGRSSSSFEKRIILLGGWDEGSLDDGLLTRDVLVYTQIDHRQVPEFKLLLGSARLHIDSSPLGHCCYVLRSVPSTALNTPLIILLLYGYVFLNDDVDGAGHL